MHITLKGRALEWWFLAQSITTKYASSTVCEYATFSQSNSPSEKRQWNADVAKMVAVFNNAFTNPFDIQTAPNQLINFATAVVATKEVETSILNALYKGREMLHHFVAESLVISGSAQKSFYSAMTRSQVRTMTDMNEPIIVQRRKVPVSGETMYLGHMAINATKNVSLQRVMSFKNSPIPQSLFKDDGSVLGAEKKAEFLHKT